MVSLMYSCCTALTCCQLKRQCQLPDDVPGIFMRWLESCANTSCIGIIAKFAFDSSAMSIKSFGITTSCCSEQDSRKYACTCSRCCSSKALYQPTVVSLSCVPVYTTLFASIWCGKYGLSSVPLNANCKIFMPGKLYLVLNAFTSSVMIPKSSATKQMLGNAAVTAANSSSPGASTHCPLIAVSSLDGISHEASKPLK